MCSAHPTIGPYICFAWRKRVGSHKGYSELVLDDLLLPEDLNRQVADFRRCFSLFSFLPSVHHTCSLVTCAHYYWSMHPVPPGVMHVQHPSFNFQLVRTEKQNQTIGWSLFPFPLAQTTSIRDTIQVLQVAGHGPALSVTWEGALNKNPWLARYNCTGTYCNCESVMIVAAGEAGPRATAMAALPAAWFNDPASASCRFGRPLRRVGVTSASTSSSRKKPAATGRQPPLTAARPVRR